MSHETERRLDEGRSPSGAALVVSGGDGTLFHVLQRLTIPRPPVAIVPSGRGNALARDLRGRTEWTAVDLMRVTVEHGDGRRAEYWCASSVSFGYPTDVTRKSLGLRYLRRLSYGIAGSLTIPGKRPLRVSYDGGREVQRELTGILINNTRHVGGFVALPRASCSDGVVESMELTSGYASQIAHNLSSMAGLQGWVPARVVGFRRAEVRPERPTELMLDGELLPDVAGISVEVAPGALWCRALDRKATSRRR